MADMQNFSPPHLFQEESYPVLKSWLEIRNPGGFLIESWLEIRIPGGFLVESWLEIRIPGGFLVESW